MAVTSHLLRQTARDPSWRQSNDRSRIAANSAPAPASAEPMPRNMRTRRQRTAPTAAGALSALSDRPLISVLAQTSRQTDILPVLHQFALDVTGGVCSLLFQHNPRNGLLHATSGFHLDALRMDPWVA